jgi:phosphatidylglycerol:prolipoprotein diacylglycerol transferase
MMQQLNLLRQYLKKQKENSVETLKNILKKPYTIYILALLYVLLLITVAISTQDGAPYNNIAIDLGFAEIAWYAVFILSGLIIAALVSTQEFKRKGLDVNFLYDALIYTVPLAIVGSRLYYVLFDPDKVYDSLIDVIDITQGGLSIHGAVITAFIFVYFFAKKRKVNIFLIVDIVAVGFFIGQIVGRWGNFMNQEAYGPVIESEFILNILPNFIKDQMFINGAIHHPTFLYESMLNFIGLLLLLWIRRKPIFKIGDHVALYFMYYGFIRGAIIEPLRTGGAAGDALRVFGLPVNIYLSLILFLGGGVLYLVWKRKKFKDLPLYTACDMK